MRPIYYVLIIDVLLIILFIKLIFSSYTIFLKSLADHFYPDTVLPNPLDTFANENDSRHKMNVLYAVVLFLAGITFAVYNFVLT